MAEVSIRDGHFVIDSAGQDFKRELQARLEHFIGEYPVTGVASHWTSGPGWKKLAMSYRETTR